jgi:hypothetical protein
MLGAHHLGLISVPLWIQPTGSATLHSMLWHSIFGVAVSAGTDCRPAPTGTCEAASPVQQYIYDNQMTNASSQLATASCNSLRDRTIQ